MKKSLTNQTILSLYGKSLDRLQLEMDKNKALADKVYEQGVTIRHHERTKKQYTKMILDNTSQITELTNQLTEEKLDHTETKQELSKVQQALDTYKEHINIRI